MPNKDAARLQALFASALELPEQARAAFLDKECLDNPEQHRELTRLLSVDARLAGMTAPPLGAQLNQALNSNAPAASLIGLRVGAFELREEIGRGGMGSVYRAERVDGNVTQVVAIKFVRRELLDANTLKRFQLERQLMATLEHPNIARLLDAAELADGTPYFVMEYVAGVAISAYCEREKLNVRERVALLRKACDAVAEAHRKLIVHRDLKPGNILIDAAGNPKLLDFGIAKPLAVLPGVPLSEETGTAQRYFSPHYAAPEQLTGEPVGVACDVYALGLLLFELLVGSRPFDFTGLSAGQIERLINEVPPPAPSVALARSEVREAKIRARQLQGDLDGIVLRCLRKAPNERYVSVEQLEADLGNYLDGRPVQARGGHTWYRVQKFIGRNKLAMASGVLLTLSLIVGVVSFAWQARIAEQRAAELEQVSKFQAEMLGQVNPTDAGVLLTSDVKARYTASLAKDGMTEAEISERAAAFGAEWLRVNATDAARELIDRTILKPALAAIDKQFKDQPVVQATLNQVLADRYRILGLNDQAQPLQTSALATRQRALGDEHPETLTSISAMGELLQFQGKLDEAEPYFREALRKRGQVLGEDHPDTLISITNLSGLLDLQGKSGEAEALQREALRKWRRVLGEEHPLTLNAMAAMGSLLVSQGKLEEAELYYRDSLAKRRRVQGDENPDTMIAINNLGYLLQAQGELEEAAPYLHEALEKQRRVLGEEHPGTLVSINNMGYLLQAQGRLAEAEAYYREALQKSRRVLGEEQYDTLSFINNVGGVLQAQGRVSESEPFFREVLEKRRRALGEEHPDTINSINNLGFVLQAQGKLSEAEKYYREVLEKSRHVLGEEHPNTLIFINNMGSLLRAQHKHAEAVDLLTPILAATREAFTDTSAWRTSRVLMNLGMSRAGLNQFPAAEANLLEAHAIFSLNPGPKPKDTRNCIQAIRDLYPAWHKSDPARSYDVKAAEWQRKLEDLDAASAAPVAP